MEVTLTTVDACATKCIETAGCFKFIQTDDDNCVILFDTSHNKYNIYDYGEENVPITDNYERIRGTSGELGSIKPFKLLTPLTSVCSRLPYTDSHQLYASVSKEFVGENIDEHLIPNIMHLNEVVFQKWVIDNDPINRRSLSAYAELVVSQHHVNNYRTTQFTALPAAGSSTWTTYNVYAYVRSPSRGFTPNVRTANHLTALQALANQMLDMLENNLVLPEGTKVKQTTPPKIDITLHAHTGDIIGKCESDGCTCSNGFESDGNGGCIEPENPADECSSNPEICSENSFCIKYLNGGSKCICNHGYVGDGISCTDKDECLESICPENASCSNTAGSFDCTCNQGFQKISHFCIRVDECQVNADCGENQVCSSGSCRTLQPLEMLQDIMDEMELQLDRRRFYRTYPLLYHKFGNGNFSVRKP